MSKMREDADKIVASMSPEEMNARAQAAEIGQRTILETALAAMLLQVPQPELVERSIANRLAELKNEQWPDDMPDAFWAPQTIAAGAEASAGRILAAYRQSPRYRP